MTFSKQLFPLLFLFLFFFPLRHASNPRKCSTSYHEPLRCGPLEVPIRFPFCDHPDFNLHCNDLNKTVLEIPMSGTFSVQNIDYKYQQISISDPEGCLVKRLLTFNLSGSPFSPPFLSIVYMFVSCPKDVKLPFLYRSIPCLTNSTSSFFVTSDYNLAESLLPLCRIVKRIPVPGSWPLGFSSYDRNETLSLYWDSPNCTRCEIDNLRCGLKRKYSNNVKCFGKPGHLSSGVLALIISFSIIIFFIVSICTCLRIFCGPTQRIVSQREQNGVIVAAIVTPQPRGTMAMTGLDQSTIDSYKKVELGESKRLSGTNGIVCPICLSEYELKETVRFIPKCDHCFHVECIDPWLKIHGSCPICRNSSSTV